MRKDSIFLKLFILFLIFSMAIVGLQWFLQANFFNRFYQQQKINQMIELGQELKQQFTEEGLSNKTKEKINTVADTLNGNLRIFDRRGGMIYQTGMMMGMSKMGHLSMEDWNRVQLGETIVFKVPGHMRKLDALALVFPIEAYIIVLHTPLQPIEESIAISQEFAVYVLIGAMILAMILAFIFSKTITKPLTKLNGVAMEMGRLNFDNLWEDDRKDEIGQLGATFNFLSSELKKTFDELQEELKKEKNLDKMRKEFVARVSHELQTPIALIQGYTEALQDDVANNEEEKQDYFHIIEEEISKMSTMVKDLLDLSQLESANFKVKLESFDIVSLVDRTLFKFDVLKKEKKVQLMVEEALQEQMVLGDEYRIEQVLSNLIQNAINHCNIGGKVEITLKDIGEFVCIEVYNEGKQIDKEDLNYIWESFYKEKDKKVGTGLGLAIVRNVLELHGSNYGVKNIEGGVLFYFQLKKQG
ncbi:sensor histidine kinase [Alkaliphilus hydrothermalis]|uniref:histidine kinase n=1 Tax=Alkaliphilus hydrothermalis TaxID=1482730 RepID=A0ABS2NP51_9FIRM|nr:HAMP domain-containing sensor histidine kinase [Alkaliphilus hydrothermalis]MBM7614711.1 signal transduction histidine kinase [Alkaliphilus hydrothermalis]